LREEGHCRCSVLGFAQRGSSLHEATPGTDGVDAGAASLLREVRQDVDDRPVGIAEHEAPHSPLLVTQRIGDVEVPLLLVRHLRLPAA
jgi:hypothetical protein